MKFFLIIFLFLSLSRPAWAEVFLLSQPIQQTVDAPKTAVASAVGFDLLWTSASTYTYYQITGEPYSSAAYFGAGLLEGVPTGNAYVQSINQAIATWKNRSTMKQIARLKGVKEIRILNTGHSEQTGIYSSRLHSSSFVFIETEGDQLPPPIDGKEWLPLQALDDSQIKFSLQLPHGTTHPDTLEIGLKELFSGAGGDQKVLGAWRESVRDWQRSLSFVDRFIRHKGLADLKVNAELSIHGESFPLGEFAHGKGTTKIVGLSKVQRLKAWITRQSLKGRENWETSNISILKKGGCRTWYSRLLGRKILVQ